MDNTIHTFHESSMRDKTVGKNKNSVYVIFEAKLPFTTGNIVCFNRSASERSCVPTIKYLTAQVNCQVNSVVTVVN